MHNMERPAQCPHCGNVYMADSDFCRHCGRKRDTFDDFREFCTKIISNASENLCNHYEREIQQLTTDLVTCRTQLGRCAELLGQQLAKEQTYRDIIERLSESSMRVLQNFNSPGVDDAMKQQLHQMLEAMHQQSSSYWQDGFGHLHAHKELAETHLMTSAELQNQAEAVQKELDNIMRVLKEPPVRPTKLALPGHVPNAALTPPAVSAASTKPCGFSQMGQAMSLADRGPSLGGVSAGARPWAGCGACGAGINAPKPAFQLQVDKRPGVDPAIAPSGSSKASCMTPVAPVWTGN
ncbi:Cep164 [Symbiodinium natans]|uniref:Cep164 protein n=1 Tax=Symbiodinium natans TaxID=878477 RepID=A0A812UVZ3_9DINO|nr:Cep164 [Symbiodinium natans]